MPRYVLVLDSLPDRRHNLIEHVLQPAGFRTIEANRTNVALSLSEECDLILVYHQPIDALHLAFSRRSTLRT